MGDFVFFGYFFRISGFPGFLGSVPPPRDRNTLILPERIFSGNRVADISGNPFSSPVHIASNCAETRPHFLVP